MWYYTLDGQQQGPVDDATLDQLISSGTISPETYLWKEGQADWLPLRQARPSPVATDFTAPPVTGICSKCGKNVGADNLVDLLGVRVCADCKPLALQAIQEGTPVSALNADTAWVEGKRVVTHDKNVLPHRCFKCNQQADGAPIKRKVYWHPAIYYVLLPIGVVLRITIIPYLVVAMIVRKRATVEIFLCAQHRQRRRVFITAGWVGIALAFAMFIGAGITALPWMVGAGFLMLLATILLFIFGGRLGRAARIKDGTVWLSGAGKAFLASLPQWPSTK